MISSNDIPLIIYLLIASKCIFPSRTSLLHLRFIYSIYTQYLHLYISLNLVLNWTSDFLSYSYPTKTYPPTLFLIVICSKSILPQNLESCCHDVSFSNISHPICYYYLLSLHSKEIYNLVTFYHYKHFYFGHIIILYHLNYCEHCLRSLLVFVLSPWPKHSLIFKRVAEVIPLKLS